MLPEQQTEDAAAERLWHFATVVYAEKAVAGACLRAQDAQGVDVNLLLFAAWCAAEGRALDAAQLEIAVTHCASWRDEVVESLRRTRRRWKDLPARAADYAAIKTLELAAERSQLSMLAELLDNPAFAAAGHAARWPASAAGTELLAANLAAAADAQGVDPAVLGDLRQALGNAAPRVQSAPRKPPDW